MNKNILSTSFILDIAIYGKVCYTVSILKRGLPMYMKLKDGKSKVLTFSYDDGVVQDIRLIGILNQYGIKATFNINTGLYVPEETQRERYYGRMKLSEAKEIYTDSGHEVAVHALTHPFLETLKTPRC